MSPTLTRGELADVSRCASLHELGRLAADFTRHRSHIVASRPGGITAGCSFQWTSHGLQVWSGCANRWRDAPRVISWAQIRGHLAGRVTDDWRQRFRAVDARWCRVVSGCVVEQRATTDEERVESRRLAVELASLAEQVWCPGTEAAGVQLDLFAEVAA